MKLGIAFYLLSQISNASAGKGSKDSLPTIVDDLVEQNIEYADGESCLKHSGYTVALTHCNYDGLAEAVEELIPLDCPHAEGSMELNLIFGSEAKAHEEIKKACKDAWDNHKVKYEYPWSEVTGYGEKWDKEYYDGHTDWNEVYETIVDAIDPENPGNHLKTDAARVRSLFEGEAKYYPIEVPSHLDNFDDCELRSMMCCWTADRQANDNNGNCAKPYDENCVDADPGDNTDLCSVDMTRSVEHNHINGGLALFPGDSNNNDDNGAEGPIHCHGLAWGEDEMEADARYRANNLFFVSMYDHMYQRGYVRNVQGAPMCGCVEKMPKVSRSDCTEIDAEEQWLFTWDSINDVYTAELEKAKLNFNACNGNPNNNNLESFYRRLYNEGRATHEEFMVLKETVVGDNQCDEAIEKSIIDAGFEIKPDSYATNNDWFPVKGYQVSVAVSGDGEALYGLSEDGELMHYNSGSESGWESTNDDGKEFQSISLNYDASMLWAVTRDDEVMLREGGIWTLYDRRPLKMISVSSDGNHLWGINRDYETFYKPGKEGYWEKIEGPSLKQLSVNHDGSVVWAVDINFDTYYLTTGSSEWTKINDGNRDLMHVSAYGDAGGFFGVSKNGVTYIKESLESGFETIPGQTRMVATNEAGDGLYGVDKFFSIFYRYGILGMNGENYALKGTASQSSTEHGGVASRAIDGNTNGQWNSASTTHTSYGKEWWKVELKNEVKVNKVIVSSRTDCCHWRLNSAIIELIDAGGQVVASQQFGPYSNTYAFVFDETTAKTVRIRLQQNEHLSLAEVQVFGEEL